MHAGIVMLILFWAIGTAPAARAYLDLEKSYKCIDGKSFMIAVLYGLFWPVAVIATIAWFWRSMKTVNDSNKAIAELRKKQAEKVK